MIENSRLLKAVLCCNSDQDGSELHAHIVLKSLLDILIKFNISLANKVILEIGSYSHPGLALLFLLQGAKKVVLNNVSNITNLLPKEYIENLNFLARLSSSNPADIYEFVNFDGSGEYACVKPELIEIIPNCDCCDLHVADNSIDILITSSVLEHVTRLPEAINKISRLMKPGGWCMHSVDIRDHRDFSNPIEFLKLSELEYRSAGRTDNRYRAVQYINFFLNEGLYPVFKGYVTPLPVSQFGTTDMYNIISQPVSKIMKEHYDDVQVSVTELQRSELDESFRCFSLKELSITGIALLCYKPK